MARDGFDATPFEELFRCVEETLDPASFEKMATGFVTEMAYRAEKRIKKRTPVDTGHLRRSWMTTPAKKIGDSYVATIANNVEYAAYVEFGHRVGRNGTRWVDGRFMMTKSMAEIEQELPGRFERKMKDWLKRLD